MSYADDRYEVVRDLALDEWTVIRKADDVGVVFTAQDVWSMEWPTKGAVILGSGALYLTKVETRIKLTPGSRLRWCGD